MKILKGDFTVVTEDGLEFAKKNAKNVSSITMVKNGNWWKITFISAFPDDWIAAQASIGCWDMAKNFLISNMESDTMIVLFHEKSPIFVGTLDYITVLEVKD